MTEKVTGIIVLDGSDNTGKTTLANYFVQRYGAVHMHQFYRFKTRMFTYHTACLRKAVALSKDHLVVLDRLWLSEDIYAMVYRNGSRWPYEGRFIDRVLLKHGAVQVIATTDPATYAERFNKAIADGRGEEWVSKPKDIAQAYYNVYHGSASAGSTPSYAQWLSQHGGMHNRADVMEYDMGRDGDDLESYSHKVVSKLVALREKQYAPCLDPGYELVTGYAATADTILVGDSINPKSRHIKWPFYDYGYSSLFLTEALQLANVDETRLLITNACTSAGVIHVADLLKIAPNKKVIALGQHARARLTDANIAHVCLSHPQYFKRFVGPATAYATAMSKLIES